MISASPKGEAWLGQPPVKKIPIKKAARRPPLADVYFNVEGLLTKIRYECKQFVIPAKAGMTTERSANPTSSP
jgi:hypothetical protein